MSLIHIVQFKFKPGTDEKTIRGVLYNTSSSLSDSNARRRFHLLNQAKTEIIFFPVGLRQLPQPQGQGYSPYESETVYQVGIGGPGQ